MSTLQRQFFFFDQTSLHDQTSGYTGTEQPYISVVKVIGLDYFEMYYNKEIKGCYKRPCSILLGYDETS